MTRGEIVKLIRTNLEMNQKQFAAFTGEEQSYISNIETGRIQISFDRFMQIVSAAGYGAETIIVKQKHKIKITHGTEC